MNFLRTSMNAVRGEEVPVREFAKLFREQSELLEFDQSFSDRYLNEGFSGGEKKRHEILQMALLQPRVRHPRRDRLGPRRRRPQVVASGVNRLRGPDSAS